MAGLVTPGSEDDERIELLRKHVTFMEGQCAQLERAWERVPRLGAFALFAVPAWIFRGFGMALIVVALTGALIVTGAYLTGIRRSWAKTELADTRRNLASLIKARDAARARPNT
jgi:hypothetical protein